MEETLTPEILLTRWKRVLQINPSTKYEAQIKRVIEELEERITN